MLSLNRLLVAITLFTHSLAASRRPVSPADDPALELMECGQLPPIRVPHRAGMEVMECRPLSDSLPLDLTGEGFSTAAANFDLPAGSRHSSSDNMEIFDTALEQPTSQRMSSTGSEMEMIDLGLIGLGHLNSSAPNGTFPAPAISTGTATNIGNSPSRARCMQCMESCVGPMANATEAVGDFCSMSRNYHCTRDQQIGCALISVTCCSMLSLALGIYNAATS